MTVCVGLHKPKEGDENWRPPQAALGYLCNRCRDRLSSLIVQMPSLAVWLHENIAAGGCQASDRVSGSREDPMPLRADVLDMIGPTSSREISRTMSLLGGIDMPADQVGLPSIADVLGSWCLLVSEENGDGWPPRDDLSTLCKWLHSQLGWIVYQPWVDDMLTELADLARKAERLAPREAEHRWLQPPCPSCNTRTLIFTRGVGVACESKIGGCGRTWTDESFDRLVLVLGTEALGGIA